MFFIAMILLGFGFLFILYYVFLINRRTCAQRAFARIEAQLRKRHEAVPGILEAAQRSKACDATLIREITLLRAVAEQLGAERASERFGMEAALQERIERLLQTLESVSDLRTDQTLLQAQMRYAEAEAQIGAARTLYNAAADAFNKARCLWPFNIVGRTFGAGPMPLFRLDRV